MKLFQPIRHSFLSGRMVAVAAAAVLTGACVGASDAAVPATGGEPEFCPRPPPGSDVPEPRDLRSHGGVLALELTIRNTRQADGSVRYCYLMPDGSQSPTLRLQHGDLLILRLKNGLKAPGTTTAESAVRAPVDACSSGEMSPTATNLHFHGLSVPPVCHQDEVMKTSVPAGGTFEYRFRIPANEPAGLYWYHPHIHGFSMRSVLGGASGALIVAGLERSIPEVAGLPERVLVIRDQDLLNPNAAPAKSEPVTPKILLDADGDTINTHTGYGKPAKDLSINYVPVPYPDYPPAPIRMRPAERQLWRVLNASAITYLHLAVVFRQQAQRLGVVAIDGVPINISGPDASHVDWVDHIGVPPGGRVEFIVSAPPAGVPGLLVTRSVDTGASGENDPNRALASLIASADAPEPAAALQARPQPPEEISLPWLGNVQPVRVRKLYFSETSADPNDPQSPVSYFITEQGKEPKPFDPGATEPDISVRQGDVEDWIIENRTTELHAFHIHQIHFLLLEWFGLAVNEPFLRDTINVPFYAPQMSAFPSVRIRMDFRDPATVGTFVYHCHLLEHEDGGMMGTIRVEPMPPAPVAAGARSGRSMGQEPLP
jgi:FtsP/CotA-like multicopper oxidase with cupredoxin domain